MNKIPIFSFLGITAAALLLNACAPSAPSVVPATPSEIRDRISNSTAELTLLHVWATWCDPCREEFPELIRVMQKYPSIEVILVSADEPTEARKVRAFLSEHQFPTESLITTELSEQFIEVVSPEWRGALPASIWIRDGSIVEEWEGKRTFEQYAETIETLLKP